MLIQLKCNYIKTSISYNFFLYIAWHIGNYLAESEAKETMVLKYIFYSSCIITLAITATLYKIDSQTAEISSALRNDDLSYVLQNKYYYMHSDEPCGLTIYNLNLYINNNDTDIKQISLKYRCEQYNANKILCLIEKYKKPLLFNKIHNEQNTITMTKNKPLFY